MGLVIGDILNASIFVAGITGAVKYKRIDATFQPFVFLIWIGCINEILSYFLVARGFETVVNNNIYFLVESLILVWHFEKVGSFTHSKSLVLFLVSCFLLLWFAEAFIFNGTINKLIIYSRTLYSLIVVLLSVSSINRLLVFYQDKIFKSPVFLISVGLILYFTLSVFVNAFWIWGITKSQHFLMKIFYIVLIANFISNMIFTVAILCINKRRFSSNQSEILVSN